MEVLDKLFSSTRAELLSLFFNNLDSKFYLREIARHISKDAAGIKRELDTLVKIGLMAQEKRGVQKYYFANKNSPIFTKYISTESLRNSYTMHLNIHLPGMYGSGLHGPTIP